MNTSVAKKTLFNRFLDGVEVVGNKLPHPATLFAIMTLLIVAFSAIAAALNLTANHPVTGELVTVKNLLTSDGVRWMWTNIEKNFVDFPPLGLVLVVMVGIGVAEGSGLFTVMVRQLVLGAPRSMITAAIITAGIISHLASEAGYVILIPLGAMIFHAIGRHPMAGFAAAFCGVSAGFGSNFLIGSVDPILAGLSTSAAQIINPNIMVNPMVNYFFMFTSAVMVVVVGTFVTEKVVEPRLGKYEGAVTALEIETLTKVERRGLRFAGLGALLVIALLAWSIIPENGLLRDPETGGVLHSPFFKGIVVAIFLIFFIPGLLYGIITKTIKNDKDVVKHMTNSMKGMGGYIVLVFFAAQFVYFFKESNLGIVLAINGAAWLKSVGLTGIPLLISFILLSAFINLFMGSASAKWAIMAPVFVPMFMLLNYHPGLAQAAFRIGDSVTNVITPMMSYFALIVTFSQKYDEKYGIGTIISMMLPFTIIFLIIWTIIICIWYLTGFPLGLDGPIYLNAGA
jgi:aminobenzoyl-glutamate transport protein